MTKTLKIEGMSCMHCVGAVTKALKAVSGVNSVEVDLESKSATVEISGTVIDKMLCDTVEEADYQVVKIM